MKMLDGGIQRGWFEEGGRSRRFLANSTTRIEKGHAISNQTGLISDSGESRRIELRGTRRNGHRF
jgi:hypothetical protein